MPYITLQDTLVRRKAVRLFPKQRDENRPRARAALRTSFRFLESTARSWVKLVVGDFDYSFLLLTHIDQDTYFPSAVMRSQTSALRGRPRRRKRQRRKEKQRVKYTSDGGCDGGEPTLKGSGDMTTDWWIEKERHMHTAEAT